MNLKPLFFALISLLSCAGIAQAQPELPNLGVLSKDGIVVLSWLNPYKNGISSVMVERSIDSSVNYQPLGLISNPQESRQGFIDPHPLIGDNWYRVVVLFSSGTEWISNVERVMMDSTSIMNRSKLKQDDSLKLLLQGMDYAGEKSLNSYEQTPSYPKSRYVFSNPFTGNIDIVVDDARKVDYSLYFYDPQDKEVLYIPRINEPEVILDRRNFQKAGLFHFKLMRGNEEFDKGYITVY